MKTAVIVIFLLTWFPALTIAGESDDEKLVASLFPGRLTIESALFTDPPVKEYVFVRADLEKPGALNYVVALYTNSVSSVLEVIRPGLDGGVLVTGGTEFRLAGGSGALKLRDLDGDGRPEILASVRFNRGIETWIFAWRGGKVVWLGPKATFPDGHALTAVGQPEVLDLDGDGIAELVEPCQFPEDVADEGIVYALTNGTYSKRTSVRFTRSYLRGQGTPVVQTERFAGIDGSRDFQLRIVNGDDRGDHRSSNSVVKLNGAVVAGPEAFKPEMRCLVVPVVLSAENRLEVEMSGEPSSAISVLIERKNPAPEAPRPIAPPS